MSTGFEIWDYVLPKLRELKPKSVSIAFVNGGDYVESCIQMKGPGTLDRSLQFRRLSGKSSDNWYYPCPNPLREVELHIYDSGETELQVQTKGSSGDHVSSWKAHKVVLETVSFDAVELSEKAFCEHQIDTLDRQLGIARTLRGNLRRLL